MKAATLVTVEFVPAEEGTGSGLSTRDSPRLATGTVTKRDGTSAWSGSRTWWPTDDSRSSWTRRYSRTPAAPQ